MAPSYQDRWLPNWTVLNSPHALERERERVGEIWKKTTRKRWMCLQTAAFFLLYFHVQYACVLVVKCHSAISGREIKIKDGRHINGKIKHPWPS